MVERLIKLQAEKKRFPKGSDLIAQLKTDKALQDDIEKLSKAFLNRNVSGCNSCYMDAYLELVNLNIEKAMTKINTKFKLRAGALLRSADGDISKNVSQHNLTDENAIERLKENPKYIKYFEKHPPKEELIDLLGEGFEDILEAPIPVENAEIVDYHQELEDLQSKVAELESENESLAVDNKALSDALDLKDQELEDLQSKVAELEKALQTKEVKKVK